MTHTHDIDSRLQNWAAWATSSDGHRRAACITGAICDAMERANGAGAAVSEQGRSIDSGDAYLVGRAMIKLTLDQRRLLGLHYVDGKRPGFIAAFLRFPPALFERKLGEAQAAVEVALGY